MLKVDSYSTKGVKLTPVTLPAIWSEKANIPLLSQAMRIYIDRSHVGLRNTQTRSEVSRTTKKLYSQKGTGGARHGSRKAPTFVGGGVSLGPRAISRVLTLPVKMKRKALVSAMSVAIKEDRVIVGSFDFKKTNEVKGFMDKVLGKKVKMATFIANKSNISVGRYVRNIENARIINYADMNAFDVFFGGRIIFDKSIFDVARTKKEGVKQAK